MNMNLDWAQKYRPTAIQDVILPTNLKESLKNSIVLNITGRSKFKETYQDTFDRVHDHYQYQSSDWAVDHLMTLEWMISDFEFWLEDGQFDTDEDLD